MRILDLTREFSLEAFLRDIHVATHIEAPGSLFTGRKTVDQFGLESFMLQAALLDLTHKKAGQSIDDEDLEAAEERAGLALREGEAVILHTASGNSNGNRIRSANYPYLSENGAEFLEFRHPSVVGTDAPSLDPRDGFQAHSILMRAEILVLENLCNLDKIEHPRFQLAAFPLRLKDSASPVRAAAILEV